MNRPELTIKMPAAKRELPPRAENKSDVGDLFDRSLRRVMEDKEAPTEIAGEDGRGVFEQCDMVTGALQQANRNGRMNHDSERVKQPDRLEGKRGQLGSAAPAPKTLILDQEKVAGGKKEHEAQSSPLPGAVISGGQPATASDAHVLSGSGSTMSATSYQTFSRVLQQQLRETGAGASREWRFSFQDARLPLTQINLISQPSGGWGVSLASSGIDREVLARRLDELNIKLAKLNRNIDGVEIVKGRFQ